MKWNDNWRIEMEARNPRCMDRLAECRSTRFDIIRIARLMSVYNPDAKKEWCLDRTIQWITDWNNQYKLIPASAEEYNRLLSRI